MSQSCAARGRHHRRERRHRRSLIGHSKGIKQVLLERQLFDPTTKLKGACAAAGKVKRKAAMGEAGIGKGKSVDVPKHAGGLDRRHGMLSRAPPLGAGRLQDDFRELQNTIQELIVSRGHHCIFLPKYHPELNFIERYWSRVKWYARQAQRRDRRWAQGHREP